MVHEIKKKQASRAFFGLLPLRILQAYICTLPAAILLLSCSRTFPILPQDSETNDSEEIVTVSTETETKTDSAAMDGDSDTDGDSDSDSDADTNTDADTDSDDGPLSADGSEFDTSNDSESGQPAMADTATAGNDTDDDSVTGANTDSHVDTDSEIATETDSHTDTDSDSGTDSDAVQIAQCGYGWEWTDVAIPPFITDMVLDSAGNAWYATTQGILYQDFNGTLSDISDDNWSVHPHLPGTPTAIRSIAVDSQDRKMVAIYRTLLQIDDNGTPMDWADDNSFAVLSSNYSGINGIRRIRIDDDDRLGIMGDPADGVKVLTESNLINDTNADLFWLFEGEDVKDVAPDSDGMYLATSSGVYYVDFAGTLEDESDDTRIDLTGNPVLGDSVVSSMQRDVAGHMTVFNTNRGIVTLYDAGTPTDVDNHVWSSWPLGGSDIDFKIGPVIELEGTTAVWMKTINGEAERVSADGAPVVTFNAQSGELLITPTGNFGAQKIVADASGRRWMVHGEKYLVGVDNNMTPADVNDDTWLIAGKPMTSGNMGDLLADPNGGLWVKTVGSESSEDDCTNHLHYYMPPSADSMTMGQWTTYPYAENESGCFNIRGIDGNGIIWLQQQDNPESDLWGNYFAIDNNGTPEEVLDDTWVLFSTSEFDFVFPQKAVFDPDEGIWFGQSLFHYGADISNKDDDQMLTLLPYPVRAVARDGTNGKWIGCGNTRYSVHGPVCYLDDSDTMLDDADDTIVEFTKANGISIDEISIIQVDQSNTKWFVGDRDSETKDVCALNDNSTPFDMTDDCWQCASPSDGRVNLDSFVIDPNSDLWFGSANGITRLHVVR